VLVYIFGFAATAAPVTWVMTGELFPTRATGIGLAIIVSVNWLSNFVIATAFPPLNDVLGSFSFIPFIVLLIIFFILTIIFVPETKGKSIEEISMEFHRTTSKT
jgi:ABC-type methionine transport system permease subunit